MAPARAQPPLPEDLAAARGPPPNHMPNIRFCATSAITGTEPKYAPNGGSRALLPCLKRRSLSEGADVPPKAEVTLAQEAAVQAVATDGVPDSRQAEARSAHPTERGTSGSANAFGPSAVTLSARLAASPRSPRRPWAGRRLRSGGFAERRVAQLVTGIPYGDVLRG